jgi:hypothetical protein
MHEVFFSESRPRSNSAHDLFVSCVKKVIERNLFSQPKMHNQWANILFSFEKNSSIRIDYMSKVKQEYSTYFSKTWKYEFLEDKIKRDFPYLFHLEKEENDDTDEDGESIDEVISKAIKSVENEIVEESDLRNMETYSGEDLSLVRQSEKSYVYQVNLKLPEGQEPHLEEGDPFKLKVFRKEYLCEVVDFDFESSQLYFNSKSYIHSASFCRIYLDSTFILNGLKDRLEDINKEEIDDDLPFTKIYFMETEDLKKIKHGKVPARLKEKLDDSQKAAFDASIDNDISFIWGPPGTGKSFTLASIIMALFEMGEDTTAVCCLSNVAVDQLLNKVIDLIEEEKFNMTPGLMYRAGRTMDERILKTDYLFPNDDETRALRDKINSKRQQIKRLKDNGQGKSKRAITLKAEAKDLSEELKDRTNYLVSSSRVVFSTNSNFILSDRLCNRKFDNLIVDEASMLSLPSLIALGSRISKRIIMVGDFQQLSPIAQVKDSNLTESVFEMNEIDIDHTDLKSLHQLLNQRRSNEKIVDLINEAFYNNKLVPKIKGTDEIIESAPFAGSVIALENVPDGQVRFTKGGTRQNKQFAEHVMMLLDEYRRQLRKTFTIGVITPYKGEVALLHALLNERGYPESFNNRVKIGTIHTFQGSESDVIIYDMVDCGSLQSGKASRIGKIYAGQEGERLLNVALSRARHKLIIVCDVNYIRNIPGNTISDKTRRLFFNLSRFRNE